MRRRDLLAFMAGTAVSGPMAGHAQEAPRTIPLVCALWPGRPDAPIVGSAREAFARGLREEGYVKGQNILVEDRYGINAEQLASAANEIVGLKPDVILAGGTPGALAAKRATERIPIVVDNLADPVRDGLVSSLSRPGGNVTGYTFIAPELGPNRLPAPARPSSRDYSRGRAPSSRRLQRTHHASHDNRDGGGIR